MVVNVKIPEYDTYMTAYTDATEHSMFKDVENTSV